MKRQMISKLIPQIDPEIQLNMNEESIGNIRSLSFAAMIFMLLSMSVFLLTTVRNEPEAAIRTFKYIVGFLICFSGYCFAGYAMKNGIPSNLKVELFMTAYYLALSLWAVFISYREYLRGEQLTIFFATELLLICFLPLRPLIGTALCGIVYASLYIMLYSIDGAKGILLRNYIVLIAVSITGMYVMYHSHVRMSEKTVNLKKANEMLEFTNRHDPLTKLRNRNALSSDIPEVIGRQISVYMADINNFKQLNDTYGHVVGDEVLREAGRRLREICPESWCYRYGGDEFLVISTGRDDYQERTCSFELDHTDGLTVLLSIGKAEGMPETQEEFYELVKKADADLYEVKGMTHSRRATDRQRY